MKRPAFGPSILFIKDVEKMLNKSRLTLRRWWEAGKFPKPAYIGCRLAWRAETINKWIEENVPYEGKL